MGADVLSYVFAGFVALLIGMIFLVHVASDARAIAPSAGTRRRTAAAAPIRARSCDRVRVSARPTGEVTTAARTTAAMAAAAIDAASPARPVRRSPVFAFRSVCALQHPCYLTPF